MHRPRQEDHDQTPVATKTHIQASNHQERQRRVQLPTRDNSCFPNATATQSGPRGLRARKTRADHHYGRTAPQPFQVIERAFFRGCSTTGVVSSWRHSLPFGTKLTLTRNGTVTETCTM